ncbi:hypothetical protein BKA69DRAFT_308914 [Paraphysoderma sedebokerense]|nr:hypothetical protein BKA69DRAFT_308914 [Paraphysoderma sedebokerense]
MASDSENDDSPVYLVSPGDDEVTDSNIDDERSHLSVEEDTLEERILKEVFELYLPPKDSNATGLFEICETIDVKVAIPRQKVIVMLLGNHSAGKSSFINWYIEQPVQKVSVAIETQGFHFVTSGKRRTTLKGPATLELFPHLKDLGKMQGVLESLYTEITTATAKKSKSVTFLDTPGMVDGDMQYPFDPEEALVRLADESDLIVTFFDPIGQALCARTMNIIEKINLNPANAHKMLFFLSKADTVPDESDRQRCLIQITQNLTIRLKNKQFDLPPIFIPSTEDDSKAQTNTSRTRNHIHLLASEIEKAINLRVQNTLNTLESDCKLILSKIESLFNNDNSCIQFNKRSRNRGLFFLLLSNWIAILFALHLFLRFWDASISGYSPNEKLKKSDTLIRYLKPYNPMIEPVALTILPFTLFIVIKACVAKETNIYKARIDVVEKVR